jgi:hypothetical protein
VDDLVLVVLGCLSAATVASAVEYYRQLRRAKREYEEARGVVEDVVLSFRRQLKREGEKLEALAYKVEAVSSKDDRTLSTLGTVEKRMSAVETKADTDSEGREKLMVRMDEVEKRISDIVTSQGAVATKVVNLERQTSQFPSIPEVNLEAAIPIRREKALAQLTGTELSVLEMLVSEGSKTAPEIKGRVRLSREHTARLMKKLYEEGYLERETGKIPFKYSVKKEMEELLRKAENQAT